MGIVSPAAPKSETLVSIQALRAIAALLVLVGHASVALKEKGATFPFFPGGPFGVDLFFVISGFVMVYSSERLFGQPGASVYFFARRLARIVPLYWAATSLWVWFVEPYASTKAVLGSFFFTPHIPPEVPVLLVGWTLIFEMFFYAVFAVALLAGRPRAVVAVASLFLVSLALFYPAPNGGFGEFWGPPAPRSFAYFADPIIIEFAFGMVIALLYRSGLRLSIGVTIALVVAGCGWYSFAVPWIPRPYSCGIAAALIVAGMSLSVMRGPKGPKGPKGIKRGSIAASAVFLGDVSYALYLTHFLSFVFIAWVAAGLALNPVDYVWPYFGVMVAMSLLVASATHFGFERPLTKLLQRRLDARLRPRVGSVIPQSGPNTHAIGSST
jgi:peptidoglycan/LPS O-acetylase OafA/YrhL